jgi:hypothetical protein
MNEWNIQSRAHACEACQQPLPIGRFITRCSLRPAPELNRSDVCESCWQKQSTAAAPAPGLISRWQGVYEAPPPVTEVIQKETAETLLKKLIELNDPRYIPAGYILAVMLERKRILKVKEQIIRDGKRTFVYEQPKTGDVFTITDPGLALESVGSRAARRGPVVGTWELPPTRRLMPPTSRSPGQVNRAVASPAESSGTGAGPRRHRHPVNCFCVRPRRYFKSALATSFAI